MNKAIIYFRSNEQTNWNRETAINSGKFGEKFYDGREFVSVGIHEQKKT